MHRVGAFAEFVTVPTKVLLPCPEGLAASVACLAEPLANGVHIVNLVRHLEPKNVVVIGAGPIGLMCQQAVQVLLNVPVLISDLSAERLAISQRLGATRTVNPRSQDFQQSVLEFTDGEGADVVVDAVGGGLTKTQALTATRAGGTVVWIGLHENRIDLDSYDVTLPERSVLGSYAASLAELRLALDLLASGEVEAESWVKRYPLTQGVEAFKAMNAAQGDDLKAVLLP